MATAKKRGRKHCKKSRIKRLLLANLIALLAFLTATVIVLACLGLLGSIFTFIF